MTRSVGHPVSFEISVPDDVLHNLRRRLEMTAFAPDMANDDWRYGLPTSYLRELVSTWQSDYDWRARERAMNELPQFVVAIDGIPIHYVHVRGRGPSPTPLILSHGWPWTFWDFGAVIGPLADPGSYGGDPADAFDVIVPSLPGFGFSTPLTVAGMNFWKTADLWVTLMHEVLEYDRFAAHGGDWGALLTSQLAHKHADRLIGAHLAGAATPGLFSIDRPWADLLGLVSQRSPAELRPEVIEWERRHASHLAVQVIDPQTIAHALHDSPAGLAAWLIERRQSWSDCGGDVESVYSREFLLDTVMIYWVTRSYVTSARYYIEAWAEPWTPSHSRSPMMEAPTGLSIFHADMPPASSLDGLEQIFNLVECRQHDRGGHFAAAESPDVLVEDIRSTFRAIRETVTGS
jgi:pimeloyl-ACP methyl ester carboxylesterase